MVIIIILINKNLPKKRTSMITLFENKLTKKNGEEKPFFEHERKSK